MNVRPSSCLRALTLGLVVLTGSLLPADDWTRFRGPNGTGVSDLKGVPVEWEESDYDWVAELPGVGHAAPIVSGERLFVTSATDRGAVRMLHCLDATKGELLWSRQIGLDPSHKHAKNSWASSTPCTDGEHVFVVFADVENYTLAAYDFDGDLVWRRRLGDFESQHGQAVSPIVYEDMVILTNDQDGPSSVVAFDRRTGQTRWSTLRSFREVSYATPMILELPGRDPQLICVSGITGISGLDPQNGRVIWTTDEFPLRTVASPVYGGGLVIASCGQGGRFGVEQRAVDPRGFGNVTETHVRWTRKRGLPYVPTPVVYQGHLYNWNDEGIVDCVDLSNGETIWQERVGGNYSGSPVCIDGKLYCISESGEVKVVAASPSYRFLGSTSLGEPSNSTPAVANGRLYLRSDHRLAALKASP